MVVNACYVRDAAVRGAAPAAKAAPAVDAAKAAPAAPAAKALRSAIRFTQFSVCVGLVLRAVYGKSTDAITRDLITWVWSMVSSMEMPCHSTT